MHLRAFLQVLGPAGVVLHAGWWSLLILPAAWLAPSSIQSGVTPGYGDEVIFADGTFIDGSTAELSADGPIRTPYVVYCQVGEGESVCCALCSSGGAAGVRMLTASADEL